MSAEVGETAQEIARQSTAEVGGVGDPYGALELARELEDKEDCLEGKHPEDKDTQKDQGQPMEEISLPGSHLLPGPDKGCKAANDA